jgi:colanic acid/amylovoran biosynthesis glycosyltransferase
VHVVHCGLDASYLDGAVTAVPDARRLVCVGRLCEQKGQLLLIEAAHRLAADGTDFELVLAGDGELRGDIEALIGRYGLQGKVRITGWINGRRVREEILAARALVLPSFAEGLPVVFMEAMALRRPVISTYVAGIPELVVPGDHGWLVPPGEVAALAQAMSACLATPVEGLTKMGEAAQQRVRIRHSAAIQASRLVAGFRVTPDNRSC